MLRVLGFQKVRRVAVCFYVLFGGYKNPRARVRVRVRGVGLALALTLPRAPKKTETEMHQLPAGLRQDSADTWKTSIWPAAQPQ